MHKNKLLKYVLFDVLRSKITLAYALLLFFLSLSLNLLSASRAQVAVSLLNLVLLLVPLMSILFTTTYAYNLRDFMDLLLAQPISRTKIFMGQYLGISLSLALAYLMGLGLPLFYHGLTPPLFALLLMGVLLTFVFAALGFLAVVGNVDRVKGMAMSLLIWFYTAILFDALILVGLLVFQDYPLEWPTLILSFLNPIDLARILILLELDISALMGYTGALYKSILSAWWGMGLAIAALIAWIFTPFTLALWQFRKKDC